MAQSSRTSELAAQLCSVLGASSVENLVRLTGGASRETWRFDADGERLILQRVRPGALGGLKCEPAVLVAAAHAGVPVPRMVLDGSQSEALELPFMVVAAVEGETIARKIQRDDRFSVARTQFARDIARALAAIHSIAPSDVPGLVFEDQLRRFRDILDALGEAHPAFEIAFRWLNRNTPRSSRTSLVHGDFRLGNLLISDEGLAAVLDWELAHAGDPMEDLGWLCVKAWRFGGNPPVSGISTYEELFSAYEEASGVTVDPDAVRWWQVTGTLKWGIMCMMQASAHLTGMTRSHELAAIGRRVCENEFDLLEMLDGVW